MKSEDDCFLVGKYENLDSVLKSRDITLPTKVSIVLDLPSGRKAMVFPVVTYGCESWTIKMAE